MSSSTTIDDLPDPILYQIVSTVLPDTGIRNAAGEVCKKWLALTRTRISLRGSSKNFFISTLSPGGQPVCTIVPTERLITYFPAVSHLTLNSRFSPSHLLCPLLSDPVNWPSLSHLKLVRRPHQHPLEPAGKDFIELFKQFDENHGRALASLDLSDFYCWTKDLSTAFDAVPAVGRSLARLNLMNFSFAEGFKSHQILKIVLACPNLTEFRAACTFDPRQIGSIDDNSLLAISSNCKNLRVLHLADIFSNRRGGVDDGGEEARFTDPGLIEFFSGLRSIEELGLDVCQHVRDSWKVMDALATNCPHLRSLKLGHFHSLHNPSNLQLHGLALCKNLTSLSIKNSADLTDPILDAIARGCSTLEKIEIHGCNKITRRGFSSVVSLHRKTLVEVSISACKNLNAKASLKAVRPIQYRIRRLHIDCIWEDAEHQERRRRPPGESERSTTAERRSKRRKLMIGYILKNRNHKNANRRIMRLKPWLSRLWPKLEFFSMWIPVTQPLTPLRAGLVDCPELAEIHIKVEGNSRQQNPSSKISMLTFGIGILNRFPNLVKMKLDLGETIGCALTGQSMNVDLSPLESFYLHGIEQLGGQLRELDYWPPKERKEAGSAAVVLSEKCGSLEKLVIHGESIGLEKRK